VRRGGILTLALVVGAAGAPRAARAARDDEVPHSTSTDPGAARAAAEPEADAPELGDERRDAILLVLGMGTPIGVAGLEGIHRFGRSLELSVGFGEGLAALASAHGRLGALQWSVMPRLRIGNERTALTLGAGISAGEFAWPSLGLDCESNCGPPHPTSYTFWSNLEAGVEVWRHAFSFRAFAGVALEMPSPPRAAPLPRLRDRLRVLTGGPAAARAVGGPSAKSTSRNLLNHRRRACRKAANVAYQPATQPGEAEPAQGHHEQVAEPPGSRIGVKG
jgi:hypothetical protein